MLVERIAMKEFLRKNKLIIVASILGACFIGIVGYSIFAGKSPPTRTVTSPLAQAPKPVSKQQQQLISSLPSQQEAKQSHKEELVREGRYVSTPIEPPLPVQSPEPVPPKPQEQSRQPSRPPRESPRTKAVEALWNQLYPPKPAKGGLLAEEKQQETECPETQKVSEVNQRDIPLYDMVKAYLKVASSSLFPGYPVVAVISDPRFPRGTIAAGKLEPNYAATRLEVVFSELVYPDGTRKKVSGLAYSIDETPGIASLDVRGDIAGAGLSVVFDALKGFAQAFRKDETRYYHYWGGTEVTTKKSDDRLREAGLAAMESAMEKSGKFVDEELRKNKFKEDIIAEKYLPIYIMFTPSS